MKLYQISGKKVLHTFTHTIAPSSTPEAEAEGEGDDNDDGEESKVSVECVGFSNDAKWVASGGMDKTLKIWEATTGVCRAVCDHGDSVVALKWHIKLPVVFTAALDQVIRIWDARTGHQCHHHHTKYRFSLPLLSILTQNINKINRFI